MRRTILLLPVLALALAACGPEGEVVERTAPDLTQAVSASQTPSPSPIPTLPSPTPTPSPEPPSTFLNLRVMHATVENFVIGMYQGVFGDDPTPKELQNWTDYIIGIGNRLQRDPGLLPEDALSEALARGLNEFMDNPYVRSVVENQQENEALHDALATTQAAIDCLTDPDC